MKKQLSFAGLIAAALAYLYMVISVMRSTGEGMSFATFILWSALAWITSFTMHAEKADIKLPMTYAVGATLTTIALLAKGRTDWSTFDTIVAVLVIICVIIWKKVGSRWGLIASVVAALIAAMPFTIKTWDNPGASPIIPNTGFLIANTLTFLSAEGDLFKPNTWKLEDRIYAGVNVILCGFLVTLWVAHVL